MTKAEFARKALAKYKNQLEVENKFVHEMNFIFSNTEILRVWIDSNYDPSKVEGDSRYNTRWCTVDILPGFNEDRAIRKRAGEILSFDTSEELDDMIEILRKELKTNPDQTADYIDGITMWDKVEFCFTVKAACKHIGIE